MQSFETESFDKILPLNNSAWSRRMIWHRLHPHPISVIYGHTTLSDYNSMPRKIYTYFGWEGNGRYDSFYSWINAWVTGKTVRSLDNACHKPTRALLGWGSHEEALIKCIGLRLPVTFLHTDKCNVWYLLLGDRNSGRLATNSNIFIFCCLRCVILATSIRA